MGNCKSTDEGGTEYTKAGMMNFDTWLNKRLQKYFEDMEALVLDTRMSQKEKREIREAGEEMIGNIFKELEKIDKRFQVKKSGLIRIGDFYENTESICIDEIELFAVIENLSGETVIQAENTTVHYFETVRVNLKDKYIPKWEDCLSESSGNPACLSGEKLALRFYDYMYNAVNNLRAKSCDVIEKDYGNLELLEESGISKRDCSACLKVGWNSIMFISVLITPVLKLNKIDPYILRQECFSEMVFEAAMKCSSVLLEPEAAELNGDNYFRLSLAHTERYIMNDCVSESHKRVYRVLQFLANGYKKKATSDNQLFKKEELKTLLIMHDMKCGKENTIGECTLAVVNTMEKILADNQAGNKPLFIPSLFVDHMNLLRRSLVNKGKEITPMNVSAVSKIKEHLVNDVGRTPEYGFSKAMSKFVPVNQYILDVDYHNMKSS